MSLIDGHLIGGFHIGASLIDVLLGGYLIGVSLIDVFLTGAVS